jgi:LPXTG-site transpeptidase (sortase) family protein
VKEGTSDDAAVPGRYPVHYRGTALPGDGQTIVISGHHYTHRLRRDAAGGVFLHLDELRRGNSVYLTYGGSTYRYIVTSNRTVNCGRDYAGFKYCRRALNLMAKFYQNKVYLTTCIGDGYQRRIVTAFADHPNRS